MKRRDLIDLLLLAGLWGGSFLFMRLSVHEFGPIAMVEMRVAVASLILLPLLWSSFSSRQTPGPGSELPGPGVRADDKPAPGVVDHRNPALGILRDNWRGLAFVGIVNSVIPFTLFGVAMLSITSGLAAILNSTAPLFGAVIAFAWLRERLPWPRVIGLLIGFAGVALLVGGKPNFALGGDGWAVVAALGATLSYGISPNYTKRKLAHIPPLAIATGSQIAATIVLLPLAIALWPKANPSLTAWLGAIALGIACTGLAYILYFRLIRNIGPTRAISVTFLIPGIGMFYGALFLGEVVTVEMLVGCAVILVGTALATGIVGARAGAQAAKPES